MKNKSQINRTLKKREAGQSANTSNTGWHISIFWPIIFKQFSVWKRRNVEFISDLLRSTSYILGWFRFTGGVASGRTSRSWGEWVVQTKWWEERRTRSDFNTHTHTHLWVYFFSLTDTPRFWMNRTLVSKLKGGGKKESFLSLLLQTRTHILLDIRFLCIYQKHSSQSSSLPPLPSPTVTHTHKHRDAHTLFQTQTQRTRWDSCSTHARARSPSLLFTHSNFLLYTPILPACIRSVLALCHLYVNVCMSVFVCVCVREKASRTCYTPEVAQAQWACWSKGPSLSTTTT